MFEHILVPIDASDESLLALPPACQLAEATGARLSLLRVALAYEVPTAGSASPRRAAIPSAEEATVRAERASEIPAAIVAEATARGADLIVMATHARSGFDRLAARVSDCGVRAQGRALFGPVAETIATVAEQVHAGAIALSTHSVQGAARLVRGSVADVLLRAESCPILLVRRDAAMVPHPASASRGVPTAEQTANADAARG